MFTVGVPHIDEDVPPGWWRKTGGAVSDEEDEEIVFPDLVVGGENELGAGIEAGGMGAGELVVGGGGGDQGAGVGVGAGAGAGQPGDGNPAAGGWEPAAGIGDGAGELGSAGDAEQEILPELVEDSSADEDDVDDPVGEDDEWGPGDDAPVNPVRGGVVPAVGDGAGDVVDAVDGGADVVDAPSGAQPFILRQSSREKRGVPALRFDNMYLASTTEEETEPADC